MSRALPLVLSAVLVGGIAGATCLPHSQQAADVTAAGAGEVSARTATAVTPLVETDWKTAGLAVGAAYAKQQAAARAAAAAKAAAAAQAAADERARKAREAARASRSRRIANGNPRAIAQAMLADRGWSDQYGCLDSLWSKESGWNVYAYNSSGAYGIPQALPGSKMASAGADWRTNAATQIRWGLDYIASSYGTPCGAWRHSQSYNWY